MTRTGAVLLTIVGITFSWYACQNTWSGLREDTEKNVATVQQKAQEKDLEGTAKAVADEAKDVAVAAKDGIKNAVNRVRGQDDAPPPAAAPPADARDRSAEREAAEAAGKVKAFVRDTGSEIASEAQGAAVHLDVKQALLRAKAIDSSNINVDVDDDAQVVMLRGSVPTVAQRAEAERLALAHARGYRLKNELRVGS
jgi:osmotically-inducible protein OsmY